MPIARKQSNGISCAGGLVKGNVPYITLGAVLLAGCVSGANPKEPRAGAASITDLVENPGGYDAGKVTVRGYIRISYEGSVICESTGMEACLDVHFAESLYTRLRTESGVEYERIKGDFEANEYVEVSGGFRKQKLASPEEAARHQEVMVPLIHRHRIENVYRIKRVKPPSAAR